METHDCERAARPPHLYPGLPSLCTRHSARISLRSRTSNGASPAEPRADGESKPRHEAPEALRPGGRGSSSPADGPTPRAAATERFTTTVSDGDDGGISGDGGGGVCKHHWAWYPEREWGVILRKKDAEQAQRRKRESAVMAT